MVYVSFITESEIHYNFIYLYAYFFFHRKLTDDEKFTTDIKAQLQHICGVLLIRIKTV